MLKLRWRKGSPRPRKVRMSRSKIKVLLVVFFDWKGIVHHEFVPFGQMVNKQLYQEVLACLRMQCAGRGLTCGKTRLGCCTTTMRWLTYRSSSTVIWQNMTSIVPHLPYSPNSAPADFFLFLKLKTTLK